MSVPCEVITGTKVRKPLLAAKHLLGLSRYRTEDLAEIVPDTDKSLSFFKVEGRERRTIARDHPLDDLGLRQRIASYAAGYGIDRSNINKNLPEVTDALWQQLQETVKRSDLKAALETRRAEVRTFREAYVRHSPSARTGGKLPSPQLGAKNPRPRRTRRRVVGAAVSLIVVLSIVTVAAIVFFNSVPRAPSKSVNPDAAVCNSIDADLAKTLAIGGAGKDFFESARTSAYSRGQEASRGSDLAEALKREVSVLDAVQSWQSGQPAANSQVVDLLNSVMAAQSGVAAVCNKIGVKFHNMNTYETADGTISRSDALQYCHSAFAFLQEAASAKPTDKHLSDLMTVMIDRASYGLPPKIYASTAELETMMALALANEGDPKSEQAAESIRSYCTDLDPGAWSL